MALRQVCAWQPDSEFGRRRKTDNLRQLNRFLHNRPDTERHT